jgi:hypothetical protein
MVVFAAPNYLARAKEVLCMLKNQSKSMHR